MANTLFFAVLIVLILGVLYIMKGDNPPETGYNQTPKQYIELVEQKKAARRAAEELERSLQESADKANQALESVKTQR